MTFVYVIEAMGTPYVKIGKGPPKTRRDRLQVGCPFELRVYDSAYVGRRAGEAENLLHIHFAAYCVRGEWFQIPPDLPLSWLRLEELSARLARQRQAHEIAIGIRSMQERSRRVPTKVHTICTASLENV